MKLSIVSKELSSGVSSVENEWAALQETLPEGLKSISLIEFSQLSSSDLDHTLKTLVPNVRMKAKLRKLHQDAILDCCDNMGPLPLTESLASDREEVNSLRSSTNSRLASIWEVDRNKPSYFAELSSHRHNLSTSSSASSSSSNKPQYLPAFTSWTLDRDSALSQLLSQKRSFEQTSHILANLKAISNEHPDWKEDVSALQGLLVPVLEVLKTHNLGAADAVIKSVFMGSVFESVQKLFNSDNGIALSNAHQQTAEHVEKAAQFRERAQEARAQARIEDAIAFEKGQSSSLEKALATYRKEFDLIEDGQTPLELPREPLNKLAEQQEGHARASKACESELRTLKSLRSTAAQGYSEKQKEFTRAKSEFQSFLGKDAAVRKDLCDRLEQILKEERERERQYATQVELLQTHIDAHEQETQGVVDWQKEWEEKHSTLASARTLHQAGVEVYSKAHDFAQSAITRVEDRFQKRVQEFKENAQVLEKSYSEAYSHWYRQLRMDLYRTTKALEDLRAEVITLQHEVAKAGRRNLVQDVQAKTKQLEARSEQIALLVAEQLDLQEKLACDDDFARNVLDKAQLPFPDDLVDGIIREEEVYDLEADQAHQAQMTMAPQRVLEDLQAAKMIDVQSEKKAEMLIQFDAEVDDTSKQKVPANSYFEVEKSGQIGATVTWKFQTVRKDIDFHVAFRPLRAKEEEIERKTRVQASQGTFVFQTPGVLNLKWDNSFSHYEPKEIIYAVAKEAARTHRDSSPKNSGRVYHITGG